MQLLWVKFSWKWWGAVPVTICHTVGSASVVSWLVWCGLQSFARGGLLRTPQVPRSFSTVRRCMVIVITIISKAPILEKTSRVIQRTLWEAGELVNVHTYIFFTPSHTHTHARTHAHTHARTHTHTSNWRGPSQSDAGRRKWTWK